MTIQPALSHGNNWLIALLSVEIVINFLFQF